ncbi:MAG: carboxymethylenebutenolidase [Chromatiales bacterium 21-64-14]|nr:MAG: carboxymethylenebutenolidase [Chromatiales bacterium 21-64-14]HQU15822.1 dienelactone hydrolase family protein [Gammaproteobacteria bacterium]
MNNTVEAVRLDIGGGLQGVYARPGSAGPHPALLIFTEAYGLNTHFEQLVRRLAAAGYCTLVPDLYRGDVYDYSDVDSARARLRLLRDAAAMEDTGRALDFLAARKEVDQARIAVLGFCMGGRLAFLAHGTYPTRLRAAACFYGGGIAPERDPLDRPALLDQAPRMQGPLLLIYGAEDGSIAPEEHGRVATALSAAGRRYTLAVFPEAGHGFFCDARPSYRPAPAAEAWTLLLEFLSHALNTSQ